MKIWEDLFNISRNMCLKHVELTLNMISLVDEADCFINLRFLHDEIIWITDLISERCELKYAHYIVNEL